jgi:hypothetical protein
MPTVTDPARELADICVILGQASDKIGSTYLAEKFQVPEWSTEFYQIVFLFSKRADELIEMLSEISVDDDYRREFEEHIRSIKLAFSPNGLTNRWAHATQNYISPANVNSVKALSGLVRPIRSYPKLNDAETEELIGEVDQLLLWLEEHQLSERDFIRQAIIDGLKQFRFRLSRIGWLGWGFAQDSLRDIISAYLALERGSVGAAEAPDAEAILRKTAAWVKGVFQTVGTVKETAGDVAFMVLAFEQVVQISQGKAPLAGLLTFAGP